MAQCMPNDEDIQRRVLDELDADPHVDSPDIGVEVDDGVVTLTGTVNNHATKFAAERAAQRVVGVKAVANDIGVKSPDDLTITDTDVASAAAYALKSASEVTHKQIKITVRDGWVTLEANVDSHLQKDAAEAAVLKVMGVRGVTNLITVGATPKVSAPAIKASIKEALKRSAEVDAERIKVDVRDGRVILAGRVRASFEWEEAEKAARAIAGVSEVENQITVE